MSSWDPFTGFRLPWQHQQQQRPGGQQKKQAAPQRQQQVARDPWSDVDAGAWGQLRNSDTQGLDFVPSMQGEFPTPDFIQYVQTALMGGGLDIYKLSADQLFRIYQKAWEDPMVARNWNSAVATEGGAGIGPQVSVNQFLSDLTSQLFSPSSSNTQLLSMGLGALRDQGHLLSAGQQKYMDATGAPIPAPFAQSAITGYGYRYNEPDPDYAGGVHPGVDYDMNEGTQLYSPFEGTIVEAGWNGGFGNTVVIRLPDGHTLRYGHLAGLNVAVGQQVKPGEQVGLSGSTGNSTGPHVHVEWRDAQGQPQDPTTMFQSIWSGATYGQLGLTGAYAPVSAQDAQDRLLGIDRMLEAKFPKAVSLWQQYFGNRPNAQQLTQLVGGAANAMGQAAGSTDLASLLRQAGMPEDKIPIMVAISLAEVRDSNPNAVGKEYGEKGLWQIYPKAWPDLDQKYNLFDPLQNAMAAVEVFKKQGLGAWSTYNQGTYLEFMGRNAQVATGGAPGAQLDPRQLEDKIRGMNSHLPGMNMGQYTDMRGLVDQTSQSMLGHAGTDGIVAELFQAKKTDPASIKDWYGMHSPNEIDRASYNNVVAAARPHLASIYNESGFDPRHYGPISGQPGMPGPKQQPTPGGGGGGWEP